MLKQLKAQPEIKPTITLSVIVPFYNEQEVLPEFQRRLEKVLSSLKVITEIIYVDDGSTDTSNNIVSCFSSGCTIIRCITLSRNFGKEAAMTAGLAASLGKAVLLIDADLQDPPELIPQMLGRWQQGVDIVNMQRIKREGETWLKRFSALCFYRLINLLSEVEILENVGDFRLLSREVVNHILSLTERNRFMKGIFAWPGFDQCTVNFTRDARYQGESKWNYFKLIGLAMDGITSFSIKPLRFATVCGLLVAGSAFVYGLFIFMKTVLWGADVSGYPSIMLALLGLGGVQLLTIGLLGEYIGRVFIECKERPLYIVKSSSNNQVEVAVNLEEIA